MCAYNDPKRNIFAKYNFTLEEILININHIKDDLNVYHNHKDIILDKKETMIKAFDILETIEDRVIDTFTTLQAMAIFLENLKKEK